MSGEDRMEARFGPAGNAIAFSRQYKSSLDAPAWIAIIAKGIIKF